MIWISKLSIRVLGGARGLLGKHFLPFFNPQSLPPTRFTLSPAPHYCLGNKAHCFYPLYACASPRAAPTRCACVLLLRLGLDRGAEVPAGWRARGGRPRAALCNHRRASTFLILFSHFFTIPASYFSFIMSHAPDRITFGGTGNSYSRRALSLMNLRAHLVHIV